MNVSYVLVNSCNSEDYYGLIIESPVSQNER